MPEDKTIIKQKIKLLQKLKDYGLKEEKDAVGLTIEDQIKLNLTNEESKILIYLRECIKLKKGILTFYLNNEIDTNKEGNKKNEQY